MSKNHRRLAFVIHDLNPWGGHDRSTLEIARRLSRRWPVDVCAFTLDDPGRSGEWGDVRFHRIRPNLRHPVLAKSTFFYGACLPALEVIPRIKGERRPLIHATGACSIVSDVVQVQFVAAAWKEARARIDPDLCQAPRARAGKGGIFASAIEGYHELMLRYDVAAEHWAYSPRKTYIAISRSVADELERHFKIASGVHVVHHGVDSDEFRPFGSAESGEREKIRGELGVAPGELMVAFVGAYERKGLATAIDAVARFPAEARLKLVAIGGGGEEGFKRRARALGIEDRVRFIGHSATIAPYYRAADAFLLPTLYEPFGLVTLEAMASGLPVAVSGSSGAAEMIEDGRNGILIHDPTDASDVGRALGRLVSDSALRAECGRRARATAQARTWDRVADEYAAILEPLLR